MRQQEQPAPWGLIVVRTSLLRTVRANIQRRPLATSARRALNLRRSWRQSRTRPRDGWQRQDCGERLIDYGRLLSPRKQPTDDNPKTECLPKAGPETTFGTGNDRGTFTRDGLVTASLLPEFSPAPPSPLAEQEKSLRHHKRQQSTATGLTTLPSHRRHSNRLAAHH